MKDANQKKLHSGSLKDSPILFNAERLEYPRGLITKVCNKKRLIENKSNKNSLINYMYLRLSKLNRIFNSFCVLFFKRSKPNNLKEVTRKFQNQTVPGAFLIEWVTQTRDDTEGLLLFIVQLRCNFLAGLCLEQKNC